MKRVAEHLAELTSQRDRDLLDAGLVGALYDLLKSESIALHRCVGEASGRRWLTRAQLGPGDEQARAMSAWAELGSLPTLAEFADRHACLVQCKPLLVAGTPPVAYFPLGDDRNSVGVLEIVNASAMSAEDQRLVSSVLRVYRNLEGLLDYSERDTLTGLLNRKTFDESFLRLATSPTTSSTVSPNEEKRSALPAMSAWLGVVDIDHFKNVNDTYGHLIGDEVLLLLARLMRATYRIHDQIYRFGGEEFVIMMRCANGHDATIAMERLRDNVDRYSFPQIGHITVSVGFTELRDGDSPSSAFERADKAVYWVKQNGRNSVANHADLVASGDLSESTRESDIEMF